MRNYCIRCKQASEIITKATALHKVSSQNVSTSEELAEIVKYKSLCVECWGEIIKAHKASQFNTKPEKSADLKEGTHYYITEGLFVFTAAYHFQRGSCCGNKCKHCPYGDWTLRE